jgi:dihydrofolate reductase
MGRLIYTAICSVDGYVEDASGGFGWGAPDEEVGQFINGLERAARTHLLGRRMYETLLFWETAPAEGNEPDAGLAFGAMWRASNKVVFSRTLQSASSQRTTIERSFDRDAVQQLKESERDELTIGGAELAGLALRLGLVDEVRLFLAPVTVGGGKPALPKDLSISLSLRDERRFEAGTVYLRYDVDAMYAPAARTP